jgi:post-segregation antitoxin (ccd killing protein)
VKQKSQVTARKRRTTLTLPVDALGQAERIARARHVNLSVVVAEALASGLRIERAREHSAQVVRDYQEAFRGFNDEEMMILDGILPETRKR